MKKRAVHRGNLLFLELIIGIFFFCMMAAICVKALAAAHALTGKTRDLNFAVNEASNAAEAFRAWNESSLEQEAFFLEGQRQEQGWRITYNKDWQVVEGEGTYQLELTMGDAGAFRTGDIVVMDLQKEAVIYELQLQVVKGAGLE